MEQGTSSQHKEEVKVLLSTIYKLQLHLKKDPKNPQNAKLKMVTKEEIAYVTE